MSLLLFLIKWYHIGERVVVVDAEVGERGIDIVGVLLKLCARTDGEAHEEKQESEDLFHEKQVVISDNRL